MIRIITIEREYGSGAAAIAETLAERLGWKLWDQLLTEEIARLAHCERSALEKHEERRDPLYHRLLKSFARGTYEGRMADGGVCLGLANVGLSQRTESFYGDSA